MRHLPVILILVSTVFSHYSSAKVLEEVVISATRASDEFKAESVSQTILSDIWIEDLYVDSFEELSFFVPGLYVQEQSVNNSGYAIRGMTSNNPEATRSSRVSVWTHGMDISRQQGAYTAMYDIDRVEVFKGPVGSLFGHGGQIGGVNIINRLAELNTFGSINLGTGNYNELKLTGFYNQQLSDTNALRFSLFKHQRDGYIDNIDGTDLNSVDTEALRLGFTQLMNNTELSVQVNYEKNSPTSPAFQSFLHSPDAPYEEATSSNAENLTINRTIADIYGNIRYNFNESNDLTFAILYREVETDDTFDPDGTIIDIVEANENTDFSTLESQLQLVFSNDETITGSVAFDYFHEEVDVTFSADFDTRYLIRLPKIQEALGIANNLVNDGMPCIDSSDIICPNLFDTNGIPNPYTQSILFSSSRYEEQTESVNNTFYRLFFDFTYFLTQKFNISVGARISREELDTKIYTPDPNNLILTPESDTLLVSQAEESSSGFSGRISAAYIVNKALNLYSTYARGRRPDILNYTEQSELEHLTDETVDSFEAGMHLYVAETFSTLDLSVYYYEFKHFSTQRSGVSALSFQSDDNASASVQGVELAYIQLFGSDYLLFTNITYNDAIFDESDIIQGENRFRYAPEWSGSLSLSKEIDISDDWASRLTLQDSFQSEVFFEDDNNSNNGKNSQSGYSLINLYIDFTYTDILNINLFIKNATDKQYIVDAGNFGELFGLPTFVPGMGRHYGFNVNYTF